MSNLDASDIPPAGKSTSGARARVIYRHGLPVRMWHWVNALCVIVLLMSGLMIFNTGPFLSWGEEGHLQMPALLSVQTSDLDGPNPRSQLQIGRHTFDTSGVLGVPHQTRWGRVAFAVPPALTFPPSFDLNLGRGWHFLMAWVFMLNAAAYGLYGIATGHFRRTLLPTREQLRPARILEDIWKHLRLQRARGLEATRYNLLQKLSYAFVLFLRVPAQILSGLTMANGVTAAAPWLFDLFGGRQSARTVHFVGAMLFVLFILVHVFQVFVAGAINEMRSIITGRFTVPPER